MRPTVTSNLSSANALTVATALAAVTLRRLNVPPGTFAVAQQLVPSGEPSVAAHPVPAAFLQLGHGAHWPATHVSVHVVFW
jgi:hypothetical protein